MLNLIAPGQEFISIVKWNGTKLRVGGWSQLFFLNFIRSRRKYRLIPATCYLKRPVPFHSIVKVIHYDEET